MNEHIEGVELSSLIDGALDDAARARAAAHLSACAPCRAELESLRAFKRLAADAPRRALPADLALRLERRHVAAPPWALLTRPRVWAPAGALAAAALAAALWLRSTQAPAELPLEPLVAAHEAAAGQTLTPEPVLVASADADSAALLADDGAGGSAE